MADTGSVRRYGDLARIVTQCMGCRKVADGTIVLAHRNRGGWGLLFGRGTKSLSLTGAFICYNPCHLYADGEGRKDADWWELACQRSVTWAWQNGFLNFNAKGGDPDHALR